MSTQTNNYEFFFTFAFRLVRKLTLILKKTTIIDHRMNIQRVTLKMLSGYLLTDGTEIDKQILLTRIFCPTLNSSYIRVDKPWQLLCLREFPSVLVCYPYLWWLKRIIYKLHKAERVIEQIVTPRKYCQPRRRLTMSFRGVTICSITLSDMCYLIYYTECSVITGD